MNANAKITKASTHFSALVAPMAMAMVGIFTPTMAVLLATNDVRALGYVMLLSGALHIVGSIALVTFASTEPFIVALSLGVWIFMMNTGYLTSALSRLIDAPTHMLLEPLLYAVAWTLVASGLAWSFAAILQPDSFSDLIFCGVATTIIYGLIALATLPRTPTEMLRFEVQWIRLRIAGAFS